MHLRLEVVSLSPEVKEFWQHLNVCQSREVVVVVVMAAVAMCELRLVHVLWKKDS